MKMLETLIKAKGYDNLEDFIHCFQHLLTEEVDIAEEITNDGANKEVSAG